MHTHTRTDPWECVFCMLVDRRERRLRLKQRRRAERLTKLECARASAVLHATGQDRNRPLMYCWPVAQGAEIRGVRGQTAGKVLAAEEGKSIQKREYHRPVMADRFLIH